MKKQNVGFAFLLLGIIFAVSQDALFWWIGVLLGIIGFIIVLAAWFFGYYNRKSNDNLPALTTIAEMSESDVNSLLPGYKINQLREVWGEPNSSEDGTDSWQIGNVTLIVNYKNNGVVAMCGLKDANGASVGE